MKSVKILVLCILSLIICGCSSIKQPISGNDFFDIARDNNYKPLDITSNYDYSKSAYLINEGTFKVLFVDGKKQYDIESVFIDECKNVLGGIENEELNEKIKSGENWTSLEITKEDTFYYIIWIDNTYVYSSVHKDIKDVLKKFIKELGY